MQMPLAQHRREMTREGWEGDRVAPVASSFLDATGASCRVVTPCVALNKEGCQVENGCKWYDVPNDVLKNDAHTPACVRDDGTEDIFPQRQFLVKTCPTWLKPGEGAFISDLCGEGTVYYNGLCRRETVEDMENTI